MSRSVFTQWCYVDLACSTFSMVSVSLYDSLGVGSSKFIINTGKMCSACRLFTFSRETERYLTPQSNLDAFAALSSVAIKIPHQEEKSVLFSFVCIERFVKSFQLASYFEIRYEQCSSNPNRSPIGSLLNLNLFCILVSGLSFPSLS